MAKLQKKLLISKDLEFKVVNINAAGMGIC